MEEIYCNACWQETQGKAVHIPCDHVFCEDCAGRELLVSGQCPFCNASFESSKDMLEFQIVGTRVESGELRDLRAMLLAVGVANGARYVEELAAQPVSMEKEQARAKLQVQGRHMRNLQKALRTAETQREEEMRVAQEDADKLKALVAELKTKAAKAAAENEALRAKVDDSVRQITNWKSMYESLRDGGSCGMGSGGGVHGGSGGGGGGGGGGGIYGAGELGLGKRKQAGVSGNSGGLLGRSGRSLTPTTGRAAFVSDRSGYRPHSSGGNSAGRPASANSGRWPSFPSQHRSEGGSSGSAILPGGVGADPSPRRANSLFSPPPTRHGPRQQAQVPHHLPQQQQRKTTMRSRLDEPPSRRPLSPQYEDGASHRGRFGQVKASSALSFAGVRRV